jgi:hypothetical protein
MFIVIWFIEFGLQVFMVMLGREALSCHLQGLTVEQWFICIAWGLVVFPWRYLLVIIPLQKIMPKFAPEEMDPVTDGAGLLAIRTGSADNLVKRSGTTSFH